MNILCQKAERIHRTSVGKTAEGVKGDEIRRNSKEGGKSVSGLYVTCNTLQKELEKRAIWKPNREIRGTVLTDSEEEGEDGWEKTVWERAGEKERILS